MGLNLIMKTTAQFLATILLSLTLLSCNKGKESEGDFGVEANEGELTKAISKAVGQLDPTQMKKDQSVSHIVSLRVENSERFRPMMWDRTTILARSDKPNALVYNILVEEKDMSVDPVEEKTYEDEIIIEKTAPITSLTKANEDLTVINQSDIKTTSSSGKPKQVKYYNLKDYPLVMDAPEAVKNRPNCGGLKDCKFNVHHLEFDEVTWYTDGKVIKIKWTYEISPDVPYLANMTTVCAAQLIDYEGSRVYVRNCRYAVDFNF